jgi:hypothetical protein
MYKLFSILGIIIITVIVAGCKKDEDPVPEDSFVGNYFLELVIEEHDPSNPDSVDEEFLAPETFEVTNSELLNPITGEMISSYKFLLKDVFLGLIEQSEMVLVGTQGCPNDDDLRAVSVTIQQDGLYRLNMANCINREVIADYTRQVSE